MLNVKEVLEALNNPNENIFINILPADDKTLVYKPHNNGFVDPIENFLDGSNGIEIDKFIVREIKPNMESFKKEPDEDGRVYPIQYNIYVTNK